MECKGNFVFKTLEKRPGGTFQNDKGTDIKYPDSYIVKVDEIKNGQINERKFKFPVENMTFAHKLDELSPYTKIIMYFDVTIYSSNCKLIPIDLDIVEEEK